MAAIVSKLGSQGFGRAVKGKTAAGERVARVSAKAAGRPKKQRASDEDEPELESVTDPEHELPRPDEVPVLWHRPPGSPPRWPRTGSRSRTRRRG